MKLLRSMMLIGLVLALALGMSAQTSKGAISGVVTDPSGAAIAGAEVTITQIETNMTRIVTTNSAGLYRFDAVNLGIYKMKVSATGFAPAETEGIAVRANQTSAMDFGMKLGATNQTVTVEAEASAIALQSEEQLRGGNISGSSVAILPVPGQNSLNLMTLLPGVVPTNLSGGGSLDSGIGSVNGSRPRANNFMIDGVENNDISVAGPALTLTNTDAIQEVSVQTANFSAEFGRSGGAVINQVTKTGTNSLHGTAAWVYRSDVLNAQSFDDKINDVTKSPFIEQLPAYTIGGPVVIPHLYDGHNKTFFFAAGQWDRYSSSSGLKRTVIVPTAAGIATLQNLATACPKAALYLKSIGNMVAPTSTNSISIAVPSTVFAMTGSCNGTDRAGMFVDVGNATRQNSTVYKGNTEQARVDHNFNDKHSINFRYMWSPGNYTGPISLGLAPEFDAGYSASSYTGAITDTYVINNHLTNELRLNYFRVAVDWPLLSTQGIGTTLPLIGISNMTSLGTSSSYPQGRTFNNYELQETMTAMFGRHTLRYGLDVNKQIARQIAPMAVRGSLSYGNSGGGTTGVPLTTGLANFLDDWSGAGNAVVSKNFGNAMYHPTAFRQSYFVQDSWKLKSNLTVNLGIRYDYFGQSGNNNFSYPVVSLDPADYPNPKKAYVDKNNWGPSVGFAYSPKFGIFQDGKTVIRGGFQIGFDGFYNNLFSNMATGSPNNPLNLPYNATISMTTGACANYPTTDCKGPRGVSGTYNNLFGTLTAAPFTNPLADNASQFTANIANPYTMRYSLGVQHELNNTWILDLSYVGSQSRKLFYSVELNPRLPDANWVAGNRLNPAMGSRTVRDSGATSNYNGMQFEVRSRAKEYFFGSLLYSSSYTWSKTMDEVSETFQTSGQGTAYASSRWMVLQPHGLLLDYGVSDLDRRHRWVTTVQWDVRGPKKGLLGQALGGWSIASNIPLMSGTPYSMLNGYDRDGDGLSAGDRPDIGNPNAPLRSRAVIASVWGSSAVAMCGASGLYNPETNACTTADQVHWVMTIGAPGAHTAKRNSVFSPGMIGWDMNVLKKFRIREGMSFEARAEIFNILNHYNFNYPPNGSSALGMRLDQSVANFLPLTTQSDYYTGPGNRTIRLGAKLIF